MLIPTLILSGIVLLLANGGVYSKFLRGSTFVVGTVCLLLSLMSESSTLTAVLSVFYCIALFLHEFCAREWWRFPAISGFGTIAAFGIAALCAQPERNRLAELRMEYAYDSVEDRLPAPKPEYSSGSDELYESRLIELEASLSDRWGSRSHKLRRLHEDNVAQFVGTQGAGVGRLRNSPIRDLNEGLRPEELHVAQPNGGSARSHDETTSDIRSREGSLLDLHGAGLLDFINHENFGYVKDRRHVAGFQSHRFSKVPEPVEGWRVETLDLVGLLLHEKPVAYVSADLPRMDELRKAPIRPLDRFETGGLEKLRTGEDLAVADTATGLRMLGAIRNAKQCIECHDGRRGDLLGAFSYTLRGR